MRTAGSTILATVACLGLSFVLAAAALGQQPSRGAADLAVSGTATRGDGGSLRDVVDYVDFLRNSEAAVLERR